jgi:hypothetical protein
MDDGTWAVYTPDREPPCQIYKTKGEAKKAIIAAALEK